MIGNCPNCWEDPCICNTIKDLSKDKLIVSQQLEIQELKRQLLKFNEASKNIYTIIYGCGGPLNDNCKQYTSVQMKDFWDIVNQLGLQ